MKEPANVKTNFTFAELFFYVFHIQPNKRENMKHVLRFDRIKGSNHFFMLFHIHII